MPVPDLGGPDYRSRNVLTREAIRTERPETDGRHSGAGPQDSLGDESRVDTVVGNRKRSLLNRAQGRASITLTYMGRG